MPDKPRTTMKFVAEDRGDWSVGISPWFEEIEVTRSVGQEFTEDEIELLKQGLRDALCPDGSVTTEAEYKAAIDAENKSIDEMYGARDAG